MKYEDFQNFIVPVQMGEKIMNFDGIYLFLGYIDTLKNGSLNISNVSLFNYLLLVITYFKIMGQKETFPISKIGKNHCP